MEIWIVLRLLDSLHFAQELKQARTRGQKPAPEMKVIRISELAVTLAETRDADPTNPVEEAMQALRKLC
eukprot:1749091-Karenia_brevis.AAC.1